MYKCTWLPSYTPIVITVQCLKEALESKDDALAEGEALGTQEQMAFLERYHKEHQSYQVGYCDPKLE